MANIRSTVDINRPVEEVFGFLTDPEMVAKTGGFFRLAEPIVARMVQRQINADYANLEELLEAQS